MTSYGQARVQLVMGWAAGHGVAGPLCLPRWPPLGLSCRFRWRGPAGRDYAGRNRAGWGAGPGYVTVGQTGRPEAAGAGDPATATGEAGMGWVLGSRRYGAVRHISKQNF